MTITSPFNAQSTALEVIAGHDLSGKTALVTGASSGLGMETARALLSAHAEVILAVRDPARGERVAQQLRETTGNAQAHLLLIDLGSLASIRQAAEQFCARWSQLHVLVNNAGIMATPQSSTPDGFELRFWKALAAALSKTVRKLLPVIREVSVPGCPFTAICPMRWTRIVPSASGSSRKILSASSRNNRQQR